MKKFFIIIVTCIVVGSYIWCASMVGRFITPIEYYDLMAFGWLIAQKTFQTPKARNIDFQPIQQPLAQPLPKGVAKAGFFMDTSSDQMSDRRKQAGLGVVVQYGSTEWRQTFDSCDFSGSGTALGGGTAEWLTMATCDDRDYSLMAKDGTVFVQTGEPDDKQIKIITTINLPAGIERIDLMD